MVLVSTPPWPNLIHLSPPNRPSPKPQPVTQLHFIPEVLDSLHTPHLLPLSRQTSAQPSGPPSESPPPGRPLHSLQSPPQSFLLQKALLNPSDRASVFLLAPGEPSPSSSLHTKTQLFLSEALSSTMRASQEQGHLTVLSRPNLGLNHGQLHKHGWISTGSKVNVEGNHTRSFLESISAPCNERCCLKGP